MGAGTAALVVGVQVTVTDTLYNTEHYQETGTIVKVSQPHNVAWLQVLFEDGSDEWMHPDEVTPVQQGADK